ncbi:hypothetical protein EC973_007098 [Apophysomyces ossiformis]|uniref:Trafficking protein particle complex subunit 10 n=1 Tax=Apophysomyces ossiformis TaxID=679940 RepID=A0A8H7BW55_9FUNG|nr:hypothetical protein EC973_007098 [Apophysomyces ossiformis]
MQATYLNLYFVACDDNEIYKNKVRKQIRQWVDLIMTKKNQEWLVVYVAGQDAKRSNNYLGLKTSVYDKIRMDFSQGKQERCVYIRIHDPDGPGSDLWAGFVEKMKDSILSSFDMQVLQIQEDTRRLDMQRHMPGWNYCTFFILKEGLAQAFEIMTLYEEALIQYDELEASFFQVLRDKALAWFGHFGGADAGDDSGNILDFKRKDYRDLITKNVISVFDFRSYLFARQCRMLLKLQRIIEVCTRAQLFITSFITSIRENQDHLIENFAESWVFSACMNVVNECEPYYAHLSAADPTFTSRYNAVKADLLLTARRQLDKLGAKHGHLPNTAPFSIYLEVSKKDSPSVDNVNAPKGQITNQKLVEAISSVEAFDKMYMALSTRSIKSYDASSRSRAALTVHGDIAALKYVREKYDEAVRIFESMIWRYGEQEWSSIENSLLIKSLLKNAECLSSEDAEHYTDELVTNVARLDKAIRRSFLPMFSIAVISIIDDPALVESTSVEICIENHLPKSLHYDRLSLRLVGNDPEQIWFVIEDQVLNPGKNTFHLTSQTSTSGNYVVETCEMQIGKLVFSHNFMRAGQKKRVVRLNQDVKQLRARVSQPREICLGRSQRFAVCVETGSTPISEGKLSLESQTEGLEIAKTGKVDAIIRDAGYSLKNFWMAAAYTEYDHTSIFLKVELSCNGDLPVRILRSNIQPSKAYVVESQPSVEQWDITLFPKQTSTFVYRLVRRTSDEQDLDQLQSKVHFDVQYRTLKDEVEASVGAMLKSKLEEHKLGQHFRYVFTKMREAFLSSVDYTSYGLMDVVHLDDFDAELCESFLLHRDLKTKVQLLDLIEEFFEEHEAITIKTIKERCPGPVVSAVSFPLDIPTHKVLHTAELSFSAGNDVLVSDACPCVLRIKRSTYWTEDHSEDGLYEDFYYDVDVDYDNWLLAGKRRLRFKSKPGEVMEFPLSLVPLKTGNLLLPAVRVSAVSPNVFASTVYTNNAQQVLVKPKSKTATFFVEQQQRFLQSSYVQSPDRPVASPDSSQYSGRSLLREVMEEAAA